jgi:hypothetical protein
MPISEYIRPWKLGTLSIGLALLIVGAQIEQLPDRSTVISMVMGLLTYLTAPWAVRVFIERRWKWMPLALLYAWVSIVYSYLVWNAHRMSPEFAEFANDFREANLWPSTCLYLLCGFIWLYRGSLADAATNLRALRRRRAERP